MAQQKQYNETLENICSFSLPSNHLVVFQLIRAKPNEGVEKTSAKSEYFSFVTIAPGEGDNNNRTYNFQNSINVKYSLQEIAGLAFVLKTVAQGMGKMCLPYTKFAKSGNGTKQISVWEPAPAQVQQGQYAKPRAINITLKENNNQGISIPLTPDQAFSISESLTILFQKGLNLDFDRQVNAPKTTKNNNSYGNMNNNNGQQSNNNGFQQQPFGSAPVQQNTHQQNSFGSSPFGSPPQQQSGQDLNAGGINDDFANLLMNS